LKIVFGYISTIYCQIKAKFDEEAEIQYVHRPVARLFGEGVRVPLPFPFPFPFPSPPFFLPSPSFPSPALPPLPSPSLPSPDNG